MKPGNPVTRRPDLRERIEHLAGEAAETDRLMQNWVRWKLGGASIGVAMFMSGLGSRGHRAESSVPLANGEALDVDAAVEALPAELRQVVRVRWLDEIPDRQGRVRPWRHATASQRAKACRCAIRTYWRRLDHAHQRIRALLRAKKVEARRSRAAYEAKNASPGFVDKALNR